MPVLLPLHYGAGGELHLKLHLQLNLAFIPPFYVFIMWLYCFYCTALVCSGWLESLSCFFPMLAISRQHVLTIRVGPDCVFFLLVVFFRRASCPTSRHAIGTTFCFILYSNTVT